MFVEAFQRRARLDAGEDHAVARAFEQLAGIFARMIRLERSEEHTSELLSLMRISYAVFCLNKKNNFQIRTSEPYCNYTNCTLMLSDIKYFVVSLNNTLL